MEDDDNLLHVAKNIQEGGWKLSAKFETVVQLDDFAYKGLFQVIFFACFKI